MCLSHDARPSHEPARRSPAVELDGNIRQLLTQVQRPDAYELSGWIREPPDGPPRDQIGCPQGVRREAAMKPTRQHQRYLKPLKCIGTGTGVAGAILIALNIGAVGIGFVLFTVS